MMLIVTSTNVNNIKYVLVIAWAGVPHMGYWHCSGLEPKGLRP